MNVRLFLALLLLAGCGQPSSDRVQDDFLALHPTALIVEAGAGEGDFDHALWCIRYRLPADTLLREQVWLYQRSSGDEWGVIRRDSGMAKGKFCAGEQPGT